MNITTYKIDSLSALDDLLRSLADPDYPAELILPLSVYHCIYIRTAPSMAGHDDYGPFCYFGIVKIRPPKIKKGRIADLSNEPIEQGPPRT